MPARRKNGSGPYFYIPKLETRFEARLWSLVIRHCEEHLGLERGTVRITVLIETLPAAFELDEILYELRENITAFNAGRWDYIFSYIKRQKSDGGKVLPDRAQVTMAAPLHGGLRPARDRRLPSPGRPRHGRHVRLHPRQRR
jgi:malate synthase